VTGVDGAAVVAFAVGEDDWELADVAEHAVVEVERGNQELGLLFVVVAVENDPQNVAVDVDVARPTEWLGV